VTLVLARRIRDLVRVGLRLQQQQKINRNAPAILSMSIYWNITSRADGLGQVLKDYGPHFLDRMTNVGVAVLLAVGNTAELSDTPANNTLKGSSPQIYGGPQSPMILVGATNEQGQRADFSEYRDGGSGKLSIYAIGTNILVPGSIQDGFTSDYVFKSGSSFSTPLVAGILANLMSRDGSVTATTAKARLQSLAIKNRGGNWPLDLPKAPVVPRIANDVYVDCLSPLMQGDLPDPLYTATWYDWPTNTFLELQTAVPSIQPIRTWYDSVLANIQTLVRVSFPSASFASCFPSRQVICERRSHAAAVPVSTNDALSPIYPMVA
jgi:hypothetical protein